MNFRPTRRSWIFAMVCVLLACLAAGCEALRSPTAVADHALIPPPPVNQNIGIYDRTFTGFMAADCLRCHDGTGGTTCPDPTTSCQGVSLRHHMMLDPSSPRYKPQYGCTSCHTPDPNTGAMSVTFNCPQCHTTSPHHRSANALARHCVACHGSVVDDYDDGHYIPTYAKSVMTPEPTCRVWADATHTTCIAGGCRACHVASTAVSPNTANSATTHHGTGLGQGSNPPDQCGWCHSIGTGPGGVPTAALDIRTCETCHGPPSIHAIEYQYNTNKGIPGYGHIGADWDCWGCHGFYARYSQPLIGPTVPTVNTLLPGSVDSGVATGLVITGQSFTNSLTSYDGKVTTYFPVVVLSLLDNTGNEVASQAIAPTSFTQSEIRATVPATLRNGLWDVRVYKDHQGVTQVQSNRFPMVVKSKVAISSADLSCIDDVTVLAVTGQGFGPRPPPGAPLYGLFLGGEPCQVSSWTDARIAGACSPAAPNAEATAVGIFNANSPVSASIKGKGCH
jgi:hypothetical protein